MEEKNRQKYILQRGHQQKQSHQSHQLYYVPQPDLNSALNAIENVIEEKKISLRSSAKGDSSEINKENERSMIDDPSPKKYNEEVLGKALDELGKSLSHKIRSFTSPISIEEYENILKKSGSTSNGNAFNNKFESSPIAEGKSISYLDFLDVDDSSSTDSELNFSNSSISSDDDSESGDEDDVNLIDLDAQNRVRDLREQVRQEANRLSQMQTEVPSFAMSLAQRELSLYQNQIVEKNDKLSRKLFDNEDLEGKNNINKEDSFESKWLCQDNDFLLEDSFKDNADNIKSIQGSLKQLTLTLDSLKQSMPPKLETFHETIENIEESLDRQKDIQNGTKKASSIERAITSKLNQPDNIRNKLKKNSDSKANSRLFEMYVTK